MTVLCFSGSGRQSLRHSPCAVRWRMCERRARRFPAGPARPTLTSPSPAALWGPATPGAGEPPCSHLLQPCATCAPRPHRRLHPQAPARVCAARGHCLRLVPSLPAPPPCARSRGAACPLRCLAWLRCVTKYHQPGGSSNKSSASGRLAGWKSGARVPPGLGGPAAGGTTCPGPQSQQPVLLGVLRSLCSVFRPRSPSAGACVQSPTLRWDSELGSGLTTSFSLVCLCCTTWVQ